MCVRTYAYLQKEDNLLVDEQPLERDGHRRQEEAKCGVSVQGRKHFLEQVSIRRRLSKISREQREATQSHVLDTAVHSQGKRQGEWQEGRDGEMNKDLVSFSCVHIHCNEQGCASSMIDKYPEGRRSKSSRQQNSIENVASFSQMIECEMSVTDVLSVQHEAETWANECFEQMNLRRDQEQHNLEREQKTEREGERQEKKKEIEAMRRARDGEREQAGERVRELQSLLSEAEAERVREKEIHQDEIARRNIER